MQRTSCLHQKHKKKGQEKLIGLLTYTQGAHGQLRLGNKQRTQYKKGIFQ
jgi:hypothetical protein